MYYIFLWAIIFAISCRDKSYTEFSKIDQNYITSEPFRTFKKRTEQENERAIRRENEFVLFIHKAIAAHPEQLLQSPFTIDQSFLEKRIPGKREPHPLITSLFEMRQIYHSLGKIQNGKMQYHFFLMCKITSYKNCLVWLATERHQKIAAIHRIAPYYEAISHKVIPTIRVNPPHIYVKAEQSMEYPFKKLSTFSIQFRVNSEGTIFRGGD